VWVGRRLLIATHLDQSNYLPNQKQGAVSKYDLTVFIRLFEVSERCKLFSRFSLHSLDWTHEPHPRFPVQGRILSVGGDALTRVAGTSWETYLSRINKTGITFDKRLYRSSVIEFLCIQWSSFCPSCLEKPDFFFCCNGIQDVLELSNLLQIYWWMIKWISGQGKSKYYSPSSSYCFIDIPK